MRPGRSSRQQSEGGPTLHPTELWPASSATFVKSVSTRSLRWPRYSGPTFSDCDIDMVTVQHMSSNKHRRLGAAMQGVQGGGESGAGRPGSGGKAGRERSGETCSGNTVREIPMLSMFLQRLHQHHYFPPIRVGTINHKEPPNKSQKIVC